MGLPVETRQADRECRKPLQLGGFLERFRYFDVTPTIGREYSNVNLKEWLEVRFQVLFGCSAFVY